MYIRKISRKNKDGSTVTYVQLAHNERDPQKGFAVAKVIYNFGRLEDLDIEQLKRLVRSISRFFTPEDALQTKAALETGRRDLQFRSCHSYGGIYLLSALWQQLHLGEILSKSIRQSKYQTPISQAIFAMVANLCLAPSSKLAITEWINRDVYIPGIAGIDVQVLYRAMDYLLEHQAQLEKEIYWSVSDLLHLEVDLLFFDTTSSYFETESETALKKRGYSKDKRRDLPQVVIGLAVTRTGIPVKHWVFPGNTADMNTIETVKSDLIGWQLGRCIFVHDAGMTSEDNLQYLQRAGGHYIVGRKLKSGEAGAVLALSRKGPYTQINDRISARIVDLGDGEKQKRFVLVRNRAEEERQRLVRQQIIAVVETSDKTLSLADIVMGYKQLNDVEQAFRTLKTTLELRPNYHSKDERIRCHIFMCFLALLLARIAEHKTGKSWASIRREMNRLMIGKFTIDKNTIFQLTELTPAQQEILRRLGIKEPASIVDIQ